MIKPEEVKEIAISSTKTTETETPTPSVWDRLKDINIFSPISSVFDRVFPLDDPYKRNHIGIRGGFYKALSDDLVQDPFDLTNTMLLGYNFRCSLTPVVSLVIDFRTTHLQQSQVVTSRFTGIGIRVNGKDGQVKPFLQVSTYLVTEEDYGGHGIGIGLSTGLDIKVSELISSPVEIIYIGTDGDDMDNLSWFGLSAGVSFNY